MAPPRSISQSCKNLRVLITYKYAGMAELADAHGSGPCESNFMQVQVLLPAPKEKSTQWVLFLLGRLVTGLEAEG